MLFYLEKTTNKVIFFINAVSKTFNAPATNLRDGNWHHIAFAWSASSGSTNFFVDGVFVQAVSSGGGWANAIGGGGELGKMWAESLKESHAPLATALAIRKPEFRNTYTQDPFSLRMLVFLCFCGVREET